MNSVATTHEFDRPGLADVCRRCRVTRLDLFGSAVNGGFDSEHSDLDFLVEFETLPPAEYARHYFDLREALARLYDRDIDLVTGPSLANPHFRARVESKRRNLFMR